MTSSIINSDIPVGTKALILSKYYYGVLSKSLEGLEVERYFSILYFLKENNGCTQQHICNNLAIDKTAMVKVIDYLTGAGYVVKTVNKKDRREYFIELTKIGLQRTKDIVKCFKAIDEKMFANINAQEQAVFLQVLEKLSSSLKEMPSNDLFFNYKKTQKTKPKAKNPN